MSKSFRLSWDGRYHQIPPYIAVKLCKLASYWNVRGINEIAKREKVVDIFSKGKFELLAFIETNLKRNRKMLWCGVNGIVASVHEI